MASPSLAFRLEGLSSTINLCKDTKFIFNTPNFFLNIFLFGLVPSFC